jgi:hypothetical protein
VKFVGELQRDDLVFFQGGEILNHPLIRFAGPQESKVAKPMAGVSGLCGGAVCTGEPCAEAVKIDSDQVRISHELLLPLLVQRRPINSS